MRESLENQENLPRGRLDAEASVTISWIKTDSIAATFFMDSEFIVPRHENRFRHQHVRMYAQTKEGKCMRLPQHTVRNVPTRSGIKMA
jgi:hypothetical protein